MHSFFIGPMGSNSLAALPPEEAKHALKVLRLKAGDEVCAMDGAGARWRGEIDRVQDGAVWVRLMEALPSNESPLRLTVYQGLPKAEKLDFLAQKLTELGAAALVPVRMERCVIKLDGKDGAKRRERLDRIAREAAKQCRRGLPMAVSEPMDWRQAIQDMAKCDLVLIPWEDARGTRLQDVFRDRPDARSVGIVIGPEGGMSPGEVEALCAAGGRTVTLGPRILRTETAAVAAAALAMQLWGDL